jgi:hypothetical protein
MVALALSSAVVGSSAPAAASPVAGVEGEAPLEVDDAFTVAVGRGCTYQARVRGTLVPVAGYEAGGQYRLRFTSALRVRSTVRCAKRAEALEWERRVAGADLTREALVQAVARSATILTRATGRACRFRPTFMFDGRTFVGTWVRSDCDSWLASGEVRQTGAQAAR